MNPKRVNIIKWSTMKMQWEARLQSLAAFKGIKDFEDWAMAQSPPMHPQEDMWIEIQRGLEGVSQGEWINPEGLHTRTYGSEKDKLFNQAKELRKQINDALDVEDYEKAEILQKTLDVIKIKYDKL